MLNVSSRAVFFTGRVLKAPNGGSNVNSAFNGDGGIDDFVSLPGCDFVVIVKDVFKRLSDPLVNNDPLLLFLLIV